jgi:hypothetical protein
MSLSEFTRPALEALRSIVWQDLREPTPSL